jgi:hypothetical protein
MAGCASLCLPARSALTVPPPYLLAWLLLYFQSLAHSLSSLFRPDLLFSAAYGLFCKYRGWGSSVNSISTSLSFVIRLFSSSLQPQTSIFQQLAASCPSLCSDFTPRFLYFQQLTDTFLQTGGWALIMVNHCDSSRQRRLYRHGGSPTYTPFSFNFSTFNCRLALTFAASVVSLCRAESKFRAGVLAAALTSWLYLLAKCGEQPIVPGEKAVS